MNDCCRRVLQIKNSDVGYQSGHVGWDRPSYLFLCRIRDRVKEIFATAGVDIDTGLVLPGFKTVAEQTAWFERELSLLEKEKRAARVDLDELYDTAQKGDVARWRAEIRDTARHEEIRQHYDDLAAKAKEDAKPLEARIEAWRASCCSSKLPRPSREDKGGSAQWIQESPE